MGKKKKKDPAAEELSIHSEADWANLRTVSGLVVIDVHTKWAGPCTIMKPIINKIKNAVSKPLKVQESNNFRGNFFNIYLEKACTCAFSLLKMPTKSFTPAFRIYFKILFSMSI